MNLNAQLYSLRSLCDTAENAKEPFGKLRAIGYDGVQLSGICPLKRSILPKYQTKHRAVLPLPNVTIDGVTKSFEDEENYVGKKCYGNGHTALIYMFYDALASGKPSPVPLDEAKHALKILLAAYKSNDTDTIIKIK